ncbi:MAG: cell division protein FtsQ/DivIB [Arenicella sp.]
MNALMPRVEKRAWHYKQEKVKNVRLAKTRNQIMKLLAIILPVVAVSLFVADRLGRSDIFLIDEIEYRGVFKYVNQVEIDQITKEALNGNFFTIDLLSVQKSIMDVPWVKSVHLGREWPNKITVLIDEYEPLMRWAEGGLVMQNGVLVKTPIDSLEDADELLLLPSLAGRASDLPKMMSKINLWQRDFDVMGMTIQELSLSESHAWTLRVKNVDADIFTVRLGSMNVDARFNRFVRLFGKGETYFEQLEYVDARYPNGVVVKRKPEIQHELQATEGETDA